MWDLKSLVWVVHSSNDLLRTLTSRYWSLWGLSWVWNYRRIITSGVVHTKSLSSANSPAPYKPVTKSLTKLVADLNSAVNKQKKAENLLNSLKKTNENSLFGENKKSFGMDHSEKPKEVTSSWLSAYCTFVGGGSSENKWNSKTEVENISHCSRRERLRVNNTTCDNSSVISNPTESSQAPISWC